MTLPRILTSFVLVPVVLAAVWTGPLAFTLFVLLVAVLCAWEYALMAEEGGYPNQLVTALVGAVLIVTAFFVDGAPAGPLAHAPGPVTVFVGWVTAVFVVELFRRDKSYAFLRASTTITGVVLCALLLGHLVLIRDLRVAAGEGVRFIGRDITLFLIVVVWALDAGAWLIGRLIGRFKMAPVVSPKKTWEGAIGGTAAAVGAGWLMREMLLVDHVSAGEAIIFSLVIAVAAQFSDLIESLLKRTFGVKNSSEILPGHGGMLDRFDSFIFAAPIFYHVLIGTGRFS